MLDRDRTALEKIRREKADFANRLDRIERALRYIASATSSLYLDNGTRRDVDEILAGREQ